ncbi:nuclear transport factor 2 family protein [Marinicaulis aureus]|uniref:Nuclear transport factor 2 family protein n=1 Tax=Hyphococcus aureus TaxID=2666033 RepID=A0ABW1KZX7_9PROT
MTDTLPLPVVRYLAAKTPTEIAECFIEKGVAVDEQQTRRGRAEIVKWREDVAKINYRQDILSATHHGNQATVTCRITGDFKGSPAQLDYRFDLAGDLISRLEIA